MPSELLSGVGCKPVSLSHECDWQPKETRVTLLWPFSAGVLDQDCRGARGDTHFYSAAKLLLYETVTDTNCTVCLCLPQWVFLSHSYETMTFNCLKISTKTCIIIIQQFDLTWDATVHFPTVRSKPRALGQISVSIYDLCITKQQKRKNV